jgi:2-keto-3-deoxy-L-rhamnonate aldolase RhmA
LTTLTGLRARLHSGDLLVGALLGIPDPAVATILGLSGFDFVLVDAEHGPFTLTSLRACVEALGPTPAATIVRPAGNDPTLIKQMLELGVDGIQVPTVASAEEAAAAVQAARFAPDGHRGVGLGRWSDYGADLPRRLREANASTAVIVMIENTGGADAAAEIAAVEGIDGIAIGPFDLSASLGAIGEARHPLVLETIGRIADAAVAAGVAVGTACAPDETAAFSAQGMQLMTVFVDVLAFGAAASQAVELARSGS